MGRTVLVADDSPTIQKKAQGILKGEGYEVETVSNGVAAIKKLAKLHPLVVLADVEMPGKDGYEVCDFVKSSVDLHHVAVLLISSDLEPYDEGKGARVRADGKVKKPFEPQDLISAVARFAAQSEAAAPKPAPAPAAVPPPAFEVTPTDEEMDVGARKQDGAVAGVSEGIAFAEPAAEAPLAPMVVPEMEPIPVPSPELAPTMAIPLEPAPEAPLAETVLIEPPAEMAAAPVIPVEEAPAAASPAIDEVPIEAEPLLVEESSPAPTEEIPVETAEQTMVFRTPAQIAEPILSDETVAPAVEATAPGVETSEPTVEANAPAAEAAAPYIEEPVPAMEEPAPASEEPAPVEPVIATSLDSYSLSEAATGHVRIAPPEAPQPPEVAPEPPVEVASEPASEVTTEPPAEMTPEVPAPAAAPEAAPPIDSALVFSIVHKVVVKMSPPALAAAAIEEMAAKLAEDVLAEIQAEASQAP